MVFGRGVLIIYIVYLTSKPDGVKNLITKGVKNTHCLSIGVAGALGRVLGILAFSNEV
ncbi:hypothetical protein [Riemerella anatipestifer]|uniref:hypothetical protein n=1 Tax=Riemerella anatipestifer TaxID=34085 RepID=UPI0015E2F8CC|nr:hypothetical protein [Riemerella anatipestifer]